MSLLHGKTQGQHTHDILNTFWVTWDYSSWGASWLWLSSSSLLRTLITELTKLWVLAVFIVSFLWWQEGFLVEQPDACHWGSWNEQWKGRLRPSVSSSYGIKEPLWKHVQCSAVPSGAMWFQCFSLSVPQGAKTGSTASPGLPVRRQKENNM